MASLIRKDPHISDTVNNMGPYRALRGRVNGLGYSSDARLMPYLELARFGSAALTQTFDLWYDLISISVERWRPETHTFHLPCGECTIVGARRPTLFICHVGSALSLWRMLHCTLGSQSTGCRNGFLAMLYPELYRTKKLDAVDIGGCPVLLWSWAFYRMSFLVSMEYLSGYWEVVHCPDISSDD
ncbi:hypothetical protein PVK06_019729 [Gossypium arboreum]|uniref:Serine/threonine-protein phosphatase 7 long form homolog n=1 Tax=Gossypium arboreum TaxID=29729 RepID=A0ABR0PKT3_GOSAR|nr:hypothetical protein PVK06_019729 [Gossypium arboreum]